MKLKFLILLTAGFAVVTSCSKDNDDNTCYECKGASETKENGVIKSFNNSTEELCNKSESEIKKLEDDNTYTTTQNGVTTTSKYKCSLKK